MGDIYGYIRVSEKSQNPQRQWDIMTEQEGIPPKYIFEDRASGRDFNRKQFRISKTYRNRSHGRLHFHGEGHRGAGRGV